MITSTQKTSFSPWLSICRKLLTLSIILFIPSLKALCQDPNFAQFYTAPAFLNPSLAGSVPHFRLSTLYRNQWPSIPQAYETNLLAFDYNWDYYNSGIALLLSNDRVMEFGYMANSAAIAYSYQVPLSKAWVLRMGLKAGYVLRSYNFDKLTFADQLATGGATAENLDGLNQGYVDIGAGISLYSKNFWVGASIDHLTEPALSYTNNGAMLQEFLPIQLSLHAGYKAIWKKGKSTAGYIQPIATTYWQAGYARADIGVNMAILPFMVGGWYRNIAIPNNDFEGMPSTATILLGFKKESFSLMYSYDLGGIDWQGSTGGGHEISIVIAPTKDYRYKGGKKWQLRGVECPIVF